MKRLFAIILIGILLVGCSGNGKSDISLYEFSKKENELLNDMGIKGLRYDVNVEKLGEDDWVSVFIDKYENGKFIETEMQASLSNFLETKKKLIWSRVDNTENRDEVWKLGFSSFSTSKNIVFDDDMLNKVFIEIIDSRTIEKDSEIFLTGLLCTSNPNQSFRTEIKREELEDYIKDFDITYILGIRVKNDI